MSLKRWQKTTFVRSLKLVTNGHRRKVVMLCIAQITLSFLDLVGVLLIGAVGAIAVQNIQSHKESPRVLGLMSQLNMSHIGAQLQVVIIGTFAGVFLVVRSATSAWLTRRILYFLSFRGAQVSSELTFNFFAQPLMFLRANTEKVSIYSLTTGVEEIAIKLLGVMAIGVSDTSLLLFLATGLFVLQPLVAISSFIFFGLIGTGLHFFVSNKARLLGAKATGLGIKSAEQIANVIKSYRELNVKGQLGNAAKQISDSRYQQANFQAELSFLPNVSKYVIESAVVVGALLLGGIQFTVSNPTHAVATLTIFLTAGTRIAPALLRVQQGITTYKSAVGSAAITLDLADRLQASDANWPISEIHFKDEHLGFRANVSISNASFSYPGSTTPSLHNITQLISEGQIVAIVGPSGGGKTTMVDSILGLLDLDSGTILISGETPRTAIRMWPGAIAYVPQDVEIINGTIRQNVALGYSLSEISDEALERALEFAEIKNFVQKLPGGLDTVVGETGFKLSGGQKQRLAIARSIISKPKLLIMDEATSALDAKNEEKITNTLMKLRGKSTVIIIAHRLSSIREADLVCYIENGKLLCAGSFEEVRKNIREFNEHLQTLGL